MTTWYCVHTKPLKEIQASLHIRTTLGLETYFPRLKQKKIIRRVRREITSPLFPRYFFCRFDASISYRAVRYAPDVLDVVSSGNKPVIVSDNIIEKLMRWAGYEVDVVTIRPSLRPGDLIEITEGPMQGLQAVLLHERDDSDRVAVLLSMLDREARLMLNRSQFVRAE